MIPNAAKISCTNLRMASVLTKTSLAAHYCLPATARTVCLRIGPCRTGNRAGARVRSFDLAKEARQIGEMAKFARCPVCKNNCKLLLFFLSLSFDLILYYFRFFKLMQYSFISCMNLSFIISYIPLLPSILNEQVCWTLKTRKLTKSDLSLH